MADGAWDPNEVLIWLVAAGLVLAVSHAWAEGQRLASDNDGLV